MGGWTEAGAFEGLPVHARPGFLMAQTPTMHLDCDGIDARLRTAGFAFDTVLVASRHRAESGKPALTVHPIGNWGAADYGGLPGRLAPAAPIVMGRVLRRLAAEAGAARLKHQVTFEATHHGPLLSTPTAFVEIGTDESSWTDRGLGRVVARAILAANEESIGDRAPALVYIGGSHYAPRATDLVKAGRLNVGHILPAHAMQRGVSERAVLDAIQGTPDCRGYYVDPRLETPPPPELLQAFAALELGWWTDRELDASEG